LLVKHPQILGDSVAGTVEEVGSLVQNLAIGDQVFGFCFESAKCKGQQEFVTVLETTLSKLPSGFSLQEAVTLPNNAVTVFHAVTTDLSLPLPWPRPQATSPPHANSPILIWGGSSSCGQYAIQILSHWGYKNLLTTASRSHHAYLLSIGATHVFDYRDPAVSKNIIRVVEEQTPAVPFIFDCIGSKTGSLAQIVKVAQRGTKIAVLLPVVLKDATEDEAPEYSMDVQSQAQWAEGVEVRGVRTHFYAKNDFFRENLQPTIIPALLADGVLRPNKQKIVEGATLLERGQKALDMLRRKEVSAERLVWRVSDDSS